MNLFLIVQANFPEKWVQVQVYMHPKCFYTSLYTSLPRLMNCYPESGPSEGTAKRDVSAILQGTRSRVPCQYTGIVSTDSLESREFKGKPSDAVQTALNSKTDDDEP